MHYDDDEEDKTVAKTLWSESLIDALLLGLKKKVPDAKIKELINDILKRGYKQDYIIQKVTKEMGAPVAMRVRQIMGK